MSKFIFVVLIFTGIAAASQPLPGSYAYSFKSQGNPPKEEKAVGPQGTLTLLKMDDKKYRFWLDVNKGWPSYNQGVTDGTLVFVNDTASFDNTYEDADHPCILKFKVKGTTISINSMSSSFNCGFGNGVVADGDYVRLKKQPVMNNSWLKEQYDQSPAMVITAKKAVLYQDENATRPFAKTQYFVKGDKLINIDEREKTVYTEFISPTGKFVYGWLKKTDVKLLQ
jgi:hypothetical protein